MKKLVIVVVAVVALAGAAFYSGVFSRESAQAADPGASAATAKPPDWILIPDGPLIVAPDGVPVRPPVAAPSGTTPPGATEPSPAPTQPPPAPHAPAPADPFALLDAQFARLRSASAALRARPRTVRLGDDVDVVLRVSPLASETELLQRMQSPDSVIERGAARIAPRMTAHLVAAGATIAVVGSEERAVPGSEDTEWQWKVTPAREGALPIHVTLSAPVIVQDKETSYQVRTFDATVTVTVAPATRVASFVANNWQWLWTTVALPGALWMFRSRAKRGPRHRQRDP